MADNTSGQNFWDSLVMQQQLSPREKALRDLFVTQYLVDYDAWAAAIRIGFLKSVAGQYAQELMEDPYVRQEIAKRQQTAVANPEADRNAKKRQVEEWLIQAANYRGPGASHAARVTALANLGKIYNMLDSEADTDASKQENLIKAFREMATKMPV